MKNKHDRNLRRQGKPSPEKQPEDSGVATAEAVFQRARVHHAAGQLPEAEKLYRELLQASPNQPDVLHLLGVLGYQVGHAGPALELIDKAIEVRPDFAEAHFSRGNALYALRRYPEAVESYGRAIELNPLYAEAHNNRGSAVMALGQYDAAVESYDRAIQIKPDYADAYANRGNALGALGRYHAAVESYDEVLCLKPDLAEAHYNRGNALYALQQHKAATESFGKAIHLRADFAEAYFCRGNALHALGQHAAAVESYDRAIVLKPDFAEAYSNRGTSLFALQRYQAALENYDRAILLKPDLADAYSSRGATLHALNRHEASLESCDRALLLNPRSADAHYNRGNALHALERHEEAVESYEPSLALNPRRAEAYNNRGNALHSLQRYQEALESYEEAIRLDPEYADAYCNRGNAFQSLRQYEAALEDYSKSIRLRPGNEYAYFNRGNVLVALKRYREALESYDKALQLNPDYKYARGMRLHMKRFLCEWQGIEDEIRDLEVRITRGEKVSVPFPVLAMSSSPAVQRQVAEIQVQDKFPAISLGETMPRRPGREKIRIGYYSADFHNHATSYLIAELLERHDRNRFEILGFSFDTSAPDEMSRRVSAGMDRFLDVRAMADREITLLSRDLEVDIAVDLKGFTQDARTGIFTGRAAPIQVSYLGYPGTMGAEYIDYLIADHTLIPEESRQYYSEKIVYLPYSYQVNDSQRMISAKACARADEGLPDGAFVYCCFNNAYKISPVAFDVWMRVLGRVEGSVLWLLEENPWVAENLRKEATRRGIAAERLVFAKMVPLAEHLARHRLADLFLDTLPYNAHTTASDALWVGLPVLTHIGETFAGRVAASLLRAIDLPELVTTSVGEFEDLAVALAQDGERYRGLVQRVKENRLSAALFDIRAFTRHLEAAYGAMYERYQAGLAPEHIEVARLRT